MHLRNVQRPRSFCTCWRMLAPSILRWHGFYFVTSVTSSVHSFQLLIAITLDDIVSSQCRQHPPSSKIENHQFKLLFNHSSLPDRARLLSVSSPDAAAWLSVLPPPCLILHMDPPEFHVTLKWWLGMDLAQGFNCTFCPSLALDPLGHHAITCKHGGDVVSHHAC